MSPRIENTVRDCLEPELLELLNSQENIYVTGRPLLFSPIDASEPVLYFDDCPKQIDVPMRVGRIGWQIIPAIGHRHLPPEFISDEGYPVMHGIDMDGNSIVMGIQAALGFEVR